jgi:hypothetical protein
VEIGGVVLGRKAGVEQDLGVLAAGDRTIPPLREVLRESAACTARRSGSIARVQQGVSKASIWD